VLRRLGARFTQARLLWRCAVREQDHADKHDSDRARSRSRERVETNANAKILRTHFRKDYELKEWHRFGSIPLTQYWTASGFLTLMEKRGG
jgi:hypothetical protein